MEKKPVLLFDFDEAKKAGIKTIGVGVTWGIHDRKKLEAAQADLVFDRPDELNQV